MNWSRSLAVLALLAAAPAAAQPYPQPYYGIVSPREVMRTVAGMGLQPVSEPRLHGNVWVVRGAGREGTIVRVALDSHTGRVLEMHAVRNAYMGPGVYEPDPRYVMRDRYPPESYPMPRAGEVYETAPPAGPRAVAVPDDDDDLGQPGVPPGYVPHSSNTVPNDPRFSARPEQKRFAARPQSVPLPKARPDDAKIHAKTDANKKEAKKEDASKESVKPEVAKQAEPKKDETKSEQAAKPLTSPTDAETTASIAAKHQKQAETKKPEPGPGQKSEFPPVQPLE